MSNFGTSGPPTTLYHYCDASALESIIRTNELWLCPFAYSNDSMEGQACRDVLRRLAEESSLAKNSVDGFLEHLELFREILECFGVSLSENGDLLSQWRGYAADGTGFAIGFDRGLLNQMPAMYQLDPSMSFGGLGPSLVKVEYEEPHTIERLRGLFDSARNHIEEWFPAPTNLPGVTPDAKVIAKARSAINETLLRQWSQLFSIKGPAFKEECEWRLALTALPESPLYHYRVSRGMVVPYLKYPMPKASDGSCPVAHIMIGPKNPTPTSIIENMLRQFGHDHCVVGRSAATYR
ncbi:DUF2971 domain-containing protein [Dyella sp.]|uniref:DUF2971 domain-containing protein n=1 Tax=Dyella sp. TaxID=1869338 RepID=UPI003F7F0705